VSDPDALSYFTSRGMGALAAKMGIEVLEVDAEQVVARMPVAGNTQPLGLLHGGAYVVLGESLGSMHANLLAGEGRVAVGVDINATHTSSATEGWVTGVCRPLHVGRSMMVHEIVITNERGKRCSTVRITNFVRDAKSSEGLAAAN
jgi:1,4-dihydroxy-2-naphthoyl-CoA hydrolase